jgi:hypothetical protein
MPLKAHPPFLSPKISQTLQAVKISLRGRWGLVYHRPQLLGHPRQLLQIVKNRGKKDRALIPCLITQKGLLRHGLHTGTLGKEKDNGKK